MRNTIYRRMKLRKTILVLVGLGLFIFALIKLYDYFRLPYEPIHPMEAFPHTTGLAFSADHWFEQAASFQSIRFLKALSQDYLGEKLKVDLATIQEAFVNTKFFLPRLIEEPFAAALLPSSANNFDFVFSLDLGKSFFDFNSFLERTKAKKIVESSYNGTPVFELEMSDHSISVVHFGNLLIFSRYPVIVEETIDQLKSKHNSLFLEDDFQDVYKQNQRKDRFYLYLGLKNLPLYFDNFVTSKKKVELSQAGKIAPWLRLDLNIHKAGLDVKGVIFPAGSKDLFAAFSRQQFDEKIPIADVLPDNLAVLCWFGLTNFKKFYDNFGAEDAKDFESYFIPWIANELAYVITEPFSSNLQSEKFAVFKIKDVDLAEHYLEKYTDKVGELKVIEYNTYKIRQIMDKNLLRPIFGESFNPIHNPYYTIIDRYAIFCNSRQALEIWIDKYIVGQTMSNNTTFLQQSQNLDANINSLVYFNTDKILQLLRGYTSDKYDAKIESIHENIKSLGQGVFQLAPLEGDLSEVTGKVFSDPNSYSEISVVWKAQLKAKAVIPPAILKDESNGENIIFIQDEKNIMYVINQGGEKILRKKLEGRILSKIYQIDYYDNGRLQYFFNTAQNVYLLNQDGSPAGNYPIKLQSEASTGITVVDFDDNEDNQFFIPSVNGNVYGFEQSGRPLPGWNPRTNVGVLKFPIVHFQKAMNDYLVALTRESKLHVFKKNGRKRFGSTWIGDGSISPPDYQLIRGNSRIVCADDEGKVQVVTVDGKKFKLQTNIEMNTPVQFAFDDVTGDVRKDYITLSGNQLSIDSYYKERFKQEAFYIFDYDQDDVFSVRTKKKRKAMVGTVDQSKGQIFLIDGNGILQPGFPLGGTTRFEIMDFFDDGNDIVVVANNDQVYIYKVL